MVTANEALDVLEAHIFDMESDENFEHWTTGDALDSVLSKMAAIRKDIASHPTEDEAYPVGENVDGC